jgi:uncharacterized protein DUF4398
VPVHLRGALAASLAAVSLACASAGGPPSATRVDLAAARAAVEEARKAGAPEHAPDNFKRAQDELRQAEALVARKTPAPEAQRHADLATSEGRSAASIARLVAEMKRAGVTPGAPADRGLAARLRKSEEEQRRLEDRIELLQRDLDVTETELIRSKARLKGNETKAEASAAVAEAQILAGRLALDKSRASTLARCRESLAKAEEQLGLGNYGAAIFFALKAQDTATRSTQETPR